MIPTPYVKAQALIQTIQRRKQNATGKARYKAKLRADVFKAYGNRCNCCGENNPGFLSVDHINYNGAEHRRQLGKNANPIRVYCDIRAAGYPNTYQLLCFNCNCGKQRNGGQCPHQGLPS